MIYLLHFKVVHTRGAHQNHSVKDRGQIHSELQTKDERDAEHLFLCPDSLMQNFSKSCLKGSCTQNPLLLSRLSPPPHLSSTGGANPLQTGLLILLQHKPTCLRHTMQVSYSRLDNQTPSPYSTLSHQNSKLCLRKLPAQQVKLVFQHLNIKKIKISHCF